MKSYYDDKRSEARRRDAIMTEAVAIIHAYESECLCHIRADLSGKFGCERCKRARAFLAKLEESDLCRVCGGDGWTWVQRSPIEEPEQVECERCAVIVAKGEGE